MAVVEVKVIPLGIESTSISSFITECCSLLEESGLKHQVTPTSTVIEGDLEDVFTVVNKMHRTPFEEGVKRVITTITIDDRVDKQVDMEDMVTAVKKERLPR